MDPRKTAKRDGCAVVAETQTERSRFGGVPAAHACAVGCLCGTGSGLTTPYLKAADDEGASRLDPAVAMRSE